MTVRFSLVGALALITLPLLAEAAEPPAGAFPAPALARPAAPGRGSVLPAPLDGLAAQVVGVVGSGDKIGLTLKEGDARRTLKIGDAYQDGWVLTGLNPEIATLSKAGQARQVGLNPDSAIPQREQVAATQVTTVGAPKADPAMIDTLLQRMTATGQTIPGMDAEATQQMMAAARDYMATPAGQAAVAAAYQRAVSQYGQTTIDRFMTQAPAAGAARGAAVAPGSQ